MEKTNSAINEALSIAQAEIKSAKFNKVNPHFKNKYADLTAMRDAYQEALSKNGLSIVQVMEDKPDGMLLITRILHKSGEFIESRFPIKIEPNATMQQIGSKITYARRYSISSILSFSAEEEDDGEEDRKQKEVEENEPLLPYQSQELESIIGEDMELKSRLLAYYGKKTKRTAESISDFSQNDFKWIKELIETQKKSVKK